MTILQRIQNLFKPKKEQPKYTIERIYDANGVHLYGFGELLELPTIRRMALYEALHDATLGINSEDLTKYIDLIEDAAKKQDFAKILQATSYIRFFLSEHGNMRSIVNIAMPLIMLENEDPENYEARHIELKRKLCELDRGVLAFFLSRGVNILSSLSGGYMKSLRVEDYLSNEAARRAERIFLSLITNYTKTKSEKS